MREDSESVSVVREDKWEGECCERRPVRVWLLWEKTFESVFVCCERRFVSVSVVREDLWVLSEKTYECDYCECWLARQKKYYISNLFWIHLYFTTMELKNWNFSKKWITRIYLEVFPETCLSSCLIHCPQSLFWLCFSEGLWGCVFREQEKTVIIYTSWIPVADRAKSSNFRHFLFYFGPGLLLVPKKVYFLVPWCKNRL